MRGASPFPYPLSSVLLYRLVRQIHVAILQNHVISPIDGRRVS